MKPPLFGPTLFNRPGLTTSVESQRATYPNASAGRRLVAGIGSAGLGQMVLAVQPIILVPLFLHAWGRDVYGHWLALTALVSYFSLLDLGGQSYVGNLLAMDWARGDIEAFRRTSSRGVSVFVALAVVVLLLIVVFLFGVSRLMWTDGTGAFSLPESRWIILLCATGLVITVPGGVYATTYRATGRFVRGQMLGNGLRSCEAVTYGVLLLLGASPLTYAVAIFVAAFVRTFVIAGDIRVNTPAPTIRLNLRSAWEGRRYIKGSLTFWLLSLSTAFNQQGVLLVVAATSGAATVAAFATHRTAAGLVGYISALTMAPLLPELSRLWAQGRLSDMRQVVLAALRTVFLISGLAALFLWVMLPVVYPMWTGRRLHLDSALLAIFLVQAVLSAGWSTTAWGLLAANRQQQPAAWSLANACVTIVLAIWWVHPYGLVGVALASMAGDIICGLAVFPTLAGRFLNTSAKSVYLTMAGPTLYLVALGAALLLVLHILPYGPALVACGAATVAWLLPAGHFALGELGRQRVMTMIRARKRAVSL